MTNDPIQTRLDELRAEYQRGETMLQDLEAQEAELRASLLRIAGAMQVLEELKNDNATGEE